MAAELAARRRMAEARTAIGLTPPVQPPDTNIHRMYSAEYQDIRLQRRAAADGLPASPAAQGVPAAVQEGERSRGSVDNVDRIQYVPSSGQSWWGQDRDTNTYHCHWRQAPPWWNGYDDWWERTTPQWYTGG